MINQVRETFSVFCDGGARGNPGPAAIGFLVKDSQGQVLIKQGKKIGRATNNVAEYTAVVTALEWLTDYLSGKKFVFFLDSKLVVNQLNGLFKIKNTSLRKLIVRVRQLEQTLNGEVAYRFIPREKNKEADNLVNGSF